MTPQKTVELNNLHTKIQNEFDLGPEGLLPKDCLCLQDKERILQPPLSHTRLWVNQLGLASRAYESKEATYLNALQQQQSLPAVSCDDG